MHDENSGVLECVGDTLKYRRAGSDWSLPIPRIKLIAEYTNSDGPHLDDWFIVFVTAVDGGWFEASLYADGRDAAIKAIEAKIGATLETGLANSTEYRTRIMWPECAKDQPLMDIAPPSKKNWWQKFTDSGVREVKLSQVAREIIE